MLSARLDFARRAKRPELERPCRSVLAVCPLRRLPVLLDVAVVAAATATLLPDLVAVAVAAVGVGVATMGLVGLAAAELPAKLRRTSSAADDR